MTAAARRKQVAVVAADVAGYAALMEADEEAAHARLMRLLSAVIEPAIAAHRGQVFKRTGDGLLAAFEDPVDAVDCALSIQENLGA